MFIARAWRVMIRADKVKRRALLIVRAGDQSLHPKWLKGDNCENRNWDLHISYFGDKTPITDLDVSVTREKGPKFIGLATCLAKIEERLSQYEYIGFPDDDLSSDCQNWNRFFDILFEHQPALAQPALDLASFFSYHEFLQRKKFILRWTNFVELISPVFRRDSLSLVMPTFTENKSGWGIDWLWPKLLGAEGLTICVVDATPVLHTRAVRAGPLYKTLSDQGFPDPEVEKRQFFEKYHLNPAGFEVFSAVLRSGVTVENPANASSILPSSVARRILRRIFRIRRIAG
jgi:hypothetical protein